MMTPMEFYENSLPRPRFFDNPQFNFHQVDPPLSVMDPLLSWARDAHWSMGGLNFTRLRLQGCIEGNVNKLRAQLDISSPGNSDKKKKIFGSGSDSHPPAPIVVKRRRFLDLNDDNEEIGSDDLDRVAGESKINKKPTGSKSVEKRSKKKKEKTQKVEETNSIRSSPRLTKRRST